ncbi:carboxymuconolactone decarboxylase family protein [Micromonospora sp. A3M-1-15]|uniref:carboxymuconolactone decarboxylase family protein n=1 Tax=Micromonospora sp. A3M-1-15 TaxID=2962035 RepID=UPI0020B6B69F|nr:carboxymuconolactone decarboxylase family protein [Micromonospora sp. A3M-1-15]MCP3785118.1 carboxymuconolactone decarboxylase family protein [Micromonospora sp. A3M-1-15]
MRGTLDQVGAWFGFVPNMFTMLASNPTVLDLVMTVQMKASSLLDARTRHTIALAVSEADGCDYFLALHTAGSLKGGMPWRTSSWRGREARSIRSGLR